MKILKFFYAIFENTSLAVKNIGPKSEKLYFIFLYNFLKLEKLLFNDFLGIKKGSFKILGHRLYFPDYSLFEMMFIDIFLKRIERLETDSRKPFIIDGGANIGLASFYLKTLYPNSEIICFEPSRVAFVYLKKNLSQFDGCTLVNAALVGKNKKWTYLTAPKGAADADIGASTAPGISNIRWKNTKLKKEKVETKRLSEYIKRNQVIDFIKLDIEGLEEDVLRDLEKSKKLKLVREMFVEYHHTQKGSFLNILNLLSRNGFKIIPGGDVRPPLSPYKDNFYIAYFWAYRD